MKKLIIALSLSALGCGSDGEDGKTVVGPAGATGATGPVGPMGAIGEAGKNGDIISLGRIRDIYTKSRTSIYRITTQCNGRAISFGSGFRIDSNTIATNKHVVNYSCIVGQTKTLKIEAIRDTIDTLQSTTLYGNGPCPATSENNCVHAYSITFAPSDDLAKVTIPTSLKGNALKISPTDSVQTGQLVINMSFPLGFADLYTTTGSIASNYIGDCHAGSDYGCIALDYDFASYLITDHGSSGSPVFDQLTGDIIGVLSAGTDGENMNVSWSISASKLISSFP